MRKVILNVAVSLDGYIEGPHGEIDWCLTDQDYGLSAFLRRVDTIFIGRKSYELLLKMDSNPYPAMTKYVFSTTLKNVGDNAIVVKGNLEKEVKRIKRQKGKDVWLFGGARLVTGFLNANLIDEMHLAVHPLFLGKGKPLFQNIKQEKEFGLKDTKTYSTGLVQHIYEPKKH